MTLHTNLDGVEAAARLTTATTTSWISLNVSLCLPLQSTTIKMEEEEDEEYDNTQSPVSSEASSSTQESTVDSTVNTPQRGEQNTLMDKNCNLTQHCDDPVVCWIC